MKTFVGVLSNERIQKSSKDIDGSQSNQSKTLHTNDLEWIKHSRPFITNSYQVRVRDIYISLWRKNRQIWRILIEYTYAYSSRTRKVNRIHQKVISLYVYIYR